MVIDFGFLVYLLLAVYGLAGFLVLALSWWGLWTLGRHWTWVRGATQPKARPAQGWRVVNVHYAHPEAGRG